MNETERDSQLSALFDGELAPDPAALADGVIDRTAIRAQSPRAVNAAIMGERRPTRPAAMAGASIEVVVSL
jgi:hypothetical protein